MTKPWGLFHLRDISPVQGPDICNCSKFSPLGVFVALVRWGGATGCVIVTRHGCSPQCAGMLGAIVALDIIKRLI